ncbi:nicotinate-nucleotide--dimethylbenzimidazole phosphoribosyltransferase [Flexithrix dorotheae]|uniref:nicotinate-nucleotide--dimethylbenzimidazole phosphoribosyltransferase n=1 Tax=Flexithrix dorotheae TaxID=70993 RepID=UPI00036C73FA|nr:nicotinate-nucleotide--dimethylbenzimidazole phosphoribosyltransferase [Flexithrix dorotheae]
MDQTFEITPVNKEIEATIQQKIDIKTKPLGALGMLEKIALKVGCIQNCLTPKLNKPHIIVFAGDHGIANSGISPYPQEVTNQMVMNFLKGGAAINVFARQHQLELIIADTGVNFDFSDFGKEYPMFRDLKIAYGTKNYLNNPAMSREECEKAINNGANLISEIHQNGCNTVGFGEMGISNTSSAALLMHLFTQVPLPDCVGSGTGLGQPGINRKTEILGNCLSKHKPLTDPLNILKTFGGFEIATMTGAFLQAASLGMVILVDGFIASSALLAANAINPLVLEYCIFCHSSAEKGHQKLLEFFKAKPILNLEMKLGEGTGAAVCFPLIQSSVNFLNDMASFESAGVSEAS